MKVFVGDITKLQDVDAIVNAANGLGIMGAGVAGAIARSGGSLLKDDAKRVVAENGPFQTGDIYISDAGLMKRRGIKHIYHAVTMQFPGGRTSLHTVSKLIDNILKTAINNGLESIAFGGLGCGIGGLDKSDVARRMADVAQKYDTMIDMYVVDMNQEFIDTFKKSLSIPIDELTE